MRIIKKEEMVRSYDFTKIPASFDIETTSELVDGKKFGYMYIWQFGIGDEICFGRKWGEFVELVESLAEKNKPTSKKPLIIYVHNLAYEFQFMRKYFTISQYLASDLRTPIAVRLENNVEFRCSCLLSGVALEKLSSQLSKHDVKKAVGDLDYTLKRNSKTPLNDVELNYCVKDIEVINAYIEEQVEAYGTIQQIPYTNTGRVRRLLKNKCLYNEGKPNYKYMNFIKKLTMTPKLYNIWRRAYAGGYTHANPCFVGLKIETPEGKPMKHYDLASSYPTVILSEKFPMDSGRRVKIETIRQYEEMAKRGIIVGAVAFRNLKAKNKNVSYLSGDVNKILKSRGVKKENGRVYFAEMYATITTSIDWEIIRNFYEIDEDNVKFGESYFYSKNYLPKEIVETCLDLYEKKTTLKEDPDQLNYNLTKAMLNSIYGTMVQDPCKIRNDYEDIDNPPILEYDEQEMKNELLEDYNHSRSRFLFYPWGVCVSAYARRNLFMGIKACGDDFVYSDTDSIFTLGDHSDFFESYNSFIEKKINKCLNYHNLDIERARPKTKSGKAKPLGIFAQEEDIKIFKTWGAKRYAMIDENDNFTITIAGLSKKSGAQYIKENGGFDFFTEGMEIDEDHSGRLISTYNDEGGEYDVTDYLGNKDHVKELSFIHLGKSEYKMSIESDFYNYVMGICEIGLTRFVSL